MSRCKAEDQVLQSVHVHIDGLRDVLTRCATRTVSFAPACQGTAEWLRGLSMPASPPFGTYQRSTRPGAVIDSMLLAAQNLHGWSQERPSFDDGENLFVARSIDTEKILRSLRLEDVLSQMESYLKDTFEYDMCYSDFREQGHELMQIRAFLQEYLRFSHHSLLGISDWIKGVLKLAWIVCGLVYRLARDGLCKPLEAPESSCNMDAPGGPLEGTGMGSGSGDKDISNEIEDASQVEGLQSEEQPPSQGPDGADEKDDNALEMEEDFKGDLEDPHLTESDKDEAESEDESGPDIDEKIQDLENDAKAVDEKFWSGKKGPEDSTSGKDQDHDAPTDQPKDDADIVAKTDRETKPQKFDADRSPQDDQASEGEISSEDIDGAEDLPENSEQPDQGRKLDDMVQDADTLNLPEDMNLDLDADGGSDRGTSHEEDAMDDTPNLPDDADDEAEAGQAEAGNDALEEKGGSAEPDAVQGEGPMVDSTTEADASNDAQALGAKDGQRGGTGDSFSGHVGGSTQESKDTPNEENERSGNSPDSEAQDDTQPMRQEE
jgi:midasin